MTQIDSRGEVDIERQLMAPDGLKLSQLMFEIKQIEVTMGAPEGTWGASRSLFGTSISTGSFHGAGTKSIYWLGSQGSNTGLDYPRGNTPSPTIKSLTGKPLVS